MEIDPELRRMLDELPLAEADVAARAAMDGFKAQLSALRAYRAARVAAALEEQVVEADGTVRPRIAVEVARELGVDRAVVTKLRKEHLARHAPAAS